MKSRTNLEVEKNWKDNVRINGNEKRSTRLDVYDKDTNTVYDYKFVKNPGKGLSKRQVEKIKKSWKFLSFKSGSGLTGLLQMTRRLQRKSTVDFWKEK